MDNELEIYNGIGEDINFITGAQYSRCREVYTGGEVTYGIEGDGFLNSYITSENITSVDDDRFLEIYKNAHPKCDLYPEGYDIVIVSYEYAIAYRQIFDDVPQSMHVPVNKVYDDAGNFKGYAGIMKPF